MGEEKVTLSIPKSLYLKAEEYIKKYGGFSSVEELVEFVLEEVLSEEEQGGYSKEDEEKIKERLRALGYL